MVVPYEGQSFSTLRSQCREGGRLFEDPLFPAADRSLFYEDNSIGRVTWKRPKVRERERERAREKERERLHLCVDITFGLRSVWRGAKETVCVQSLHCFPV